MGMPMSVDRFLITSTRSGNPCSPGRDSISKNTRHVIQVSINRAGDSHEQLGKDRRGREERDQKCDKLRRKEVKTQNILIHLWK